MLLPKRILLFQKRLLLFQKRILLFQKRILLRHKRILLPHKRIFFAGEDIDEKRLNLGLSGSYFGVEKLWGVGQVSGWVLEGWVR